MKNLLLVGENPFSTTGNAKMFRYVLNHVDQKKFRVHLFNIDMAEADPVKLLDRPIPFPSISSMNYRNGAIEEPLGKRKLLDILTRKKIDVLVFIGLDIWEYADIYKHLQKIKKSRQLLWVAIFPYDQPTIRKDWVKWINMVDVPCVYSRYGFNLLKEQVPALKYFRPDVSDPNPFVFNEKLRSPSRRTFFPDADKDTFIFGFFGPNQYRKDPHKLLKAFHTLLSDPDVSGQDIRLYMHTNDMDTGVYNLIQMAIDYGFDKQNVLITKKKSDWFHDSDIAQLMHSIDCLVNCSMQEGLSWTVIEAMYAGTPVICSESTAHIELLEGTHNIGVACDQEAMLPVITQTGHSMVETRSCHSESIYLAMKKVVMDRSLLKKMSASGRKKIMKWSKGRSDINSFIKSGLIDCAPKKTKVHNKVLFAQYSSAGDVLMTTKCFKGLKDRHPDIPMVYMTQKKYHGVVEGNPFIDEIIDWDESKLKGAYRYTYNPHGDRILPAGWGRNSNNTLTDFYWKILGVPEGGFGVFPTEPVLPDFDQWDILNTKFCIVHTTGGDPEFRTYRYMKDVCDAVRGKGYLTIQLGGKEDFPAGADIDLCGRLTFRESAWVVKRATLAVTVDSFMSHLAGAMGISQVCLFGSGNAQVCRPVPSGGMLICRSPDYTNCQVLGPCSAAHRQCEVPCTGWHDPADIISDIEDIEHFIDGPDFAKKKIIFKHPGEAYEKVPLEKTIEAIEKEIF